MANVNFCGLEHLDTALPAQSDVTIMVDGEAQTVNNLGEYIDTINSYMGQPVVKDYWQNGSETIMNGDKIDAENATYEWENYRPKQATLTNVQKVIYHSAIDPECFGNCIDSSRVGTYDPHKGQITPEAPVHKEFKDLWKLATKEDIEEAKKAEIEKKKKMIITVFKFDKLFHMTLEEGQLVAFCKSGIYTYFKPVSEESAGEDTPKDDDDQTPTEDGEQTQTPSETPTPSETETPTPGEEDGDSTN